LCEAGAILLAYVAATKLVQQSTFVCIKKLREMSLTRFAGAEAFGEKQKISLTVLEL
jgi:hypothetical protein